LIPINRENTDSEADNRFFLVLKPGWKMLLRNAAPEPGLLLSGPGDMYKLAAGSRILLTRNELVDSQSV